MALSVETQNWLDGLKKEGSLTDEAFNTLKTTLEGKADEYVKGSVLRQSDYSRAMADVQKAKQDAEKAFNDKNEAVTKYQQELAQWKAGADTNFQKALKEREAAARKSEAAIARLRTLAVANGLDENEVLRDIDTAVITPKKEEETVPNIDTSKFLTREDATRVMAESALIDASIHDIAMDYMELTGQPLKGAATLVQEALKAGKPLTQYAEEKFKFGELRAKRGEADIQKRIDEAVAAKTAQLVSDGLIPGNLTPGRTDLKGSPILAGAKDLSHLPPVDHVPGGGVSAAVAAFQAGKFKQ